MKFNNLRLLVNDFDKCFTFYKDTLGLECTWGQPGENYASFNIGIPSGLALFSASLMSSAVGSDAAAAGNGSADKVAIVLQVDDVDTSYQELKNRGVEFLDEPRDMEAWGIRVAHFRDPEHNLIEIFQELRG